MENNEVCAKAHGQQVKYGPGGGRGHPVHKTETQATTLMARQLGPKSGFYVNLMWTCAKRWAHSRLHE